MHIRIVISFLCGLSTAWCQPQVIATGLQAPNKLIVTLGGNLLVSETSVKPNDGRVSLVSRAGARTSVMENLPSGADVTTAGSGPSAMALRDRTLYLAFGTGDAERRATAPATGRIYNPAGLSSPLFDTILQIRFDQDIDTITAPFRMSAQDQQNLNDYAEVELTNEARATARVSMLTRFPVAEPAPAPLFYKFSNLWGLALSDDGRNLYVADASGDSLSVVDTATGRWRRIAHFPQVPNFSPAGARIIDPVPTGVRIYGAQLLVSFLSGAPFGQGNALVQVVNADGSFQPFITNLTSATDVLWRTRADGTSQFFVIEFSENQTAAGPPPGRLLRFDSPDPQVVAELATPVSLAYDDSTKDLFILELGGEILRLRLE